MAVITSAVHETVVHVTKGVSEVSWNALTEFSWPWIGQEVFISLKLLFKFLWKLCFDICWNFVAVYTMPVANYKEMESLLPNHIGSQSIGVLVYFVRVSWLMTAWGGKSKLCNCVEPLIAFWFPLGRRCLLWCFCVRLLVGVNYFF